MSDLAIVLNAMSVVFVVGAFIIYKNTPKTNRHH